VIAFLDASALIKLYRVEPGTDTMRTLLGRKEWVGAFFISDHVALEVQVRMHKLIRTSRGRTRRELAAAATRFSRDRSDHLNELAVGPPIVARAEELAATFAKSGAGTLDLLHAASALHIRQALPAEPLTFVASDRKLKHLAVLAGFPVFDPECDPPGVLGAPARRSPGPQP
jgi:predicted nucleic acid-binding protein